MPTRPAQISANVVCAVRTRVELLRVNDFDGQNRHARLMEIAVKRAGKTADGESRGRQPRVRIALRPRLHLPVVALCERTRGGPVDRRCAISSIAGQ